jgi:hypothetical protein
MKLVPRMLHKTSSCRHSTLLHLVSKAKFLFNKSGGFSFLFFWTGHQHQSLLFPNKNTFCKEQELIKSGQKICKTPIFILIWQIWEESCVFALWGAREEREGNRKTMSVRECMYVCTIRCVGAFVIIMLFLVCFLFFFPGDDRFCSWR